jgi:ABC-2 type transport system permease protein
MLLSTIIGLIFNFSPITYTEMVRIVISYFVTLLPIMVLALIVVFLSNIFRSSSAVFFLFIHFF